MKKLSHLLKISLVFTWLITSSGIARSQSGNMSDITGPNPGEVVNDPEPSTDGGSNDVADTPDTPVDGGSDVVDTPDAPVDGGGTDVVDAPVDGGSDVADTPDAPVDGGSDVADTPDTPVDDGGSDVADTPDAPVDDGGSDVADTPDAPVDGGGTDVADTPDAPVDGGGNIADTPDTPVDGGGSDVADTPDTPVDGGGSDVADTPDTPVDGGGSDVADTPDAPVDDGGSDVADTPDTPDAPAESNNEAANAEEPVTERTTEEPAIAEEANNETTEAESEGVVSSEETTTEELGGRDTSVADEPERGSTQGAEEEADSEVTATDEPEREPSQRVEADDEDSETIADEPEKNEAVTEKEAEEEPVAQSDEEKEAEVAEETTEEAEAETEETEAESEDDNESEQSDFEQEVDRLAYEVQVQEASADVAIQMNEEFQTAQLIDYSGVQMYGQAPSVEAISRRLGQLWQQTGKKTAFINISLQSNQLEAFTVLPTVSAADANESLVASTKINSGEAQQAVLRSTIKDTSRKELLSTAKEFRDRVSNVRKLKDESYLQSSQKLYQSLIAPIEKELEANDIDILVFSMDTGLRLLPLAALHDGEQFLIEKYAIAMVPSFGLTDTRYVDPSNSQILAMGASQFTEQAPLPTMPIELEYITDNPRSGEVYLNEEFTIANFKAQNSRQKPFSIVHLGTHADFKSGDLNESYIQFYDDKLEMSELRNLSNELGWNSTQSTPIELLVLSACETAIGDDNSELGFAGLAVQAGVKSALASLWYVSDLGTLALMSEFYDQLSDTLLKAEALRQTQLQMLKGEVRIDAGKLQLSNGDNLGLPSSLPQGDLSMSHPYFWSSFTLIGNWN